MALAKNKSAAPSAPGTFENDDNTVQAPVAENPQAPAVEAPSPAAEVVAAQTASHAIAKAQSTAVAATGGRVVGVFEGIKDAMPALDFGVLPRLVGTNGLILDADKLPLGDEIKIQLVSWNHEWVLSPNDKDPEAKDLVRFSKDGLTVSDTGQSCTEYIDFLVKEGYEKAGMKQYVQLIGILMEAKKPTAHLDGMVVISLSPQSRKLFEGFGIQQGVRVRMGKVAAEGQDVVIVRAVVKSKGSDTFTLLQVSDK